MKWLISALLVAWTCSNVRAQTYEQTQGEVKVILVSVQKGRTFLPTSADSPDHPPGDSYVRVTYLMECLGDAPIRKTNSGGDTLWDGGKKLDLLGGNLPARDSFMITDFGGISEFSEFVLPKGLVKGRTKVMRTLIFGSMPHLATIEIRIKTGFNDATHEFRFVGVPVSM
ncbi:MAG: hypothetical protein HOJ57_15745 [Lentisphaerae bacterium]|nr:hypothetical protein [Lentisphaerota bacterium]MBT5607394.1 hypothetical protein [Lentisphaerota bacterium]